MAAGAVWRLLPCGREKKTWFAAPRQNGAAVRHSGRRQQAMSERMIQLHEEIAKEPLNQYV